MKPLALDDDSFARMSTKPVHLKPFDPQAKAIALDLMAVLDDQVAAWGVRSVLHGSTALEIEGKGEIEVALYLDDSNWEAVKAHLYGLYGKPWSEEENFVNINAQHQGVDVEIILLRGYDAVVNRALMDYLHAHAEARAEYVALKRAYAFSRRTYYQQKNHFFKRIIEALPQP
jgi:GrpB-like predicted nucleotidyltransferase (UPF0157 family)